MQLIDLGWDAFFEERFASGERESVHPLRITRENRGQYMAWGEAGEVMCETSGKFDYEAVSKADFPAVGDWVAASVMPDERKAVIHRVLPRKSVFSRKVPGRVTDEQVVAANIDTVFIVTGLDLNYNARRIERYLTLASNSGAVPVVLLNKSDICAESEKRKNEIVSLANGVDVYTMSALHGSGMDIFDKYRQKGKTLAFLGSSGVGKSTLINTLLGTEQIKVNDVSKTGSRGKHTTVCRELHFLPDRAMVIDTPGMREIQLWGDDDGLRGSFTIIDTLSERCRFKDCSHQTEPGCAVIEAVRNGSLDPERYQSFLKLKKELGYLSDRQKMSAGALEKKRRKSISKQVKKLKNKDR
jgi:ribosome biogenesis GTPase / thiamine phosphate phosphatase